MPNPQWLEDLFQNYTLGELQSGLEFAMPLRRETPGEKWNFEIILTSNKTPGTRIPASTLSKFKSGEWTPHERSLEKLKSLQDRFNYNRLRSSGANRQEARKLYKRKDVDSIIADYRKYTRAISEGKGVDLANVLWGMQQSPRTYASWASYLEEGGSMGADDIMSEPEEAFMDDDWEQWLEEGEIEFDDEF